jgi:hypothetical protein
MGSKDTRALLRRLRKQGFAIRLAGSGHYMVTGLTGAVVTVAATPRGGRRSLLNARADLRRIGARL